MSFDTKWLDLREPADHAARDCNLLNAFINRLPADPHLLDLGSGTGSTMRALSAVRSGIRWTLTDHDPVLLAEAKRRAPDISVQQVDLARDLAAVLDIEADAITASALIDLVSADWLDALVRLADTRMLYIALSYDGSETWSPEHQDDAVILEAFQSHQRSDKGFGPALGSGAVPYLQKALEKAGYTVMTAASPWDIGSGLLMNTLADGIAAAAQEAGAGEAVSERWRLFRHKSERCSVGHTDLFAFRA